MPRPSPRSCCGPCVWTTSVTGSACGATTRHTSSRGSRPSRRARRRGPRSRSGSSSATLTPRRAPTAPCRGASRSAVASWVRSTSSGSSAPRNSRVRPATGSTSPSPDRASRPAPSRWRSTTRSARVGCTGSRSTSGSTTCPRCASSSGSACVTRECASASSTSTARGATTAPSPSRPRTCADRLSRLACHRCNTSLLRDTPRMCRVVTEPRPTVGHVPVSSLIFVVIVAIWAAYLVQHWARRREDAAATRSVEGFSEAMRVLEKRPALPTTALSTPRPHSYAVKPPSTGRPTVDVKRAVPAGTSRRHSPLVARRSDERVLASSTVASGSSSDLSQTDHDIAPYSAEVDRMPESARPTSHADRRPARPTAPARVPLAQRRLRAALLLVAVAWLPVSVVLTVTDVLMWISIPFAVLTVAAVLVWLRAEAQADRLRTSSEAGDQRARGGRRGGRPSTSSPASSTSRRRSPVRSPSPWPPSSSPPRAAGAPSRYRARPTRSRPRPSRATPSPASRPTSSTRLSSRRRPRSSTTEPSSPAAPSPSRTVDPSHTWLERIPRPTQPRHGALMGGNLAPDHDRTAPRRASDGRRRDGEGAATGARGAHVEAGPLESSSGPTGHGRPSFRDGIRRPSGVGWGSAFVGRGSHLPVELALRLVAEEVLAHGVEHRGEGDGDERPDDAGDDRAGRDGEDDGERVDADGLAEQERLEHVRLELLHADDDGEHDEGDARAVRDEREQHGDGPREQRSDDRDERQDEDEDADREREGDLEDRGADRDADRVDEGHDHRRAHERGQLVPGDDARGVDAGAGGAREEPHDPAPDARALVEEEEEREEGDEQAGDEVRRREPDRGRGVAEVARLAHLVADGVEVLVELRVGDVERRAHPVADALETGGDLARQVGEAAAELGPDEGEEGPDEQDGAEQRDAGGRPRLHPVVQPVRDGPQQGGQEDGDRNRHDDLGDRAHRERKQVDGRADEQQAPRPLARDPDAGWHGRGDDPGQVRGLGTGVGPQRVAVVVGAHGHGRVGGRARGRARGLGMVVGHDHTVCRVAAPRCITRR